MTYELVSSMAAPHGRDGEICALAISPDGSTACTLSQEEDAFRVWVKNTTSSTAEVGSTLWKCLYKVKTPSGYANLLSQKGSQSTGEQLVSFSSDGTVLSVSYGPYITLWDHSNATLLTSVTLDECATAGRPSEDIQQVHFLTKNDDAMLLSTATQIGIKSPFGGGNNRSYLGEDEWSFDADCFGKKAHISAMVPVQDFGDVDGLFAVSVALDFGTRSIVSIINRKEGKAVCAEGTNDPLQWEINGEVQSLCVNKCSGSNVQLLAITKDCQMFSLRCGVDEQGTPTFEKQPLSSMRAQAPVLKIARDTSQTTASVKKRKIAIGGVSRGSKAARDFTGFEFPALSGKFTSAFIAKNLGRGNN